MFSYKEAMMLILLVSGPFLIFMIVTYIIMGTIHDYYEGSCDSMDQQGLKVVAIVKHTYQDRWKQRRFGGAGVIIGKDLFLTVVESFDNYLEGESKLDNYIVIAGSRSWYYGKNRHKIMDLYKVIYPDEPDKILLVGRVTPWFSKCTKPSLLKVNEGGIRLILYGWDDFSKKANSKMVINQKALHSVYLNFTGGVIFNKRGHLVALQRMNSVRKNYFDAPTISIVWALPLIRQIDPTVNITEHFVHL